MAYDARKTEWRRTRERRLLRRALVFYGLVFIGTYLMHCLETWRVDLPLAPYVLALVLVATALHALAGVSPPDAAFWRTRRDAKP